MASYDNHDQAQRGRRLRLFIALGVAALLAVVVAAWALTRPPEVSVQAATRGPAVESVYASGVVDFVRQARVMPVVSSPIRAVRVAEGDMVSQGQVLAELVDGPERASLMQLLVQVEQAASVARRTEALYARGYAAEAARDSARREWLAAA